MLTEAPTSWWTDYAHAFSAWLDGLGPWAGLSFVLLYAAGTTLFIPGSLFRFAAGAVFGLVWGIVLSIFGALLGSLIAFFLARSLMRRQVERWCRKHPAAAALTSNLGADGRKLVLMLRFSPIVPFSWSNYALGITDVSLSDFAVGTAIGILPATLTVVYLGSISRTLVAYVDGSHPATWTEWILIALGVGATIGASLILGRRVQAALRPKQSGGAPATGVTGDQETRLP